MQTECIAGQLEFEGFGSRRVVAAFDGGAVTSDAGALLLREADRAVRLIDRVASAAFRTDAIRPAWSMRCTLWSGSGSSGLRLATKTSTITTHYELDPVLALFGDSLEPKRKDCAPLGGKSTVNRLEHAPAGGGDRYHKIRHDVEALQGVFVDLFLEAYDKAPREIVLDLDATDDQE